MKRLFIILLMLTALCLFGCGTKGEANTTDVTTESVEQAEPITFIENGKSDYAIIHASGDVDSDAAYRLSLLIKRASGVSISPKKDNFVEPAQKEIVIGKTNREAEEFSERDGLIADGYFLIVKDGKLFISALTAEGYEEAFKDLFKQGFGVEDIDDMTTDENARLSLPAELLTLAEPTATDALIEDKYTVEGADKTLYGYSVSDDSLKYTLKSPKGKDFNTYAITYSSDVPIKGVITYKVSGKLVSEEFFLEEGYHKTFTSFTDGAIGGALGAELGSIELSLIKAKEMTFRLEGIDATKRDLPSSDVIYIEDGSYKLGIKLTWGGGISYLEDLRDGDDSLKNLLNDHDTGRLIQQSYYGTNSAPYVPEKYNGNTWCYNPVQGGDQYNNRSKLVDYAISEDGKTVYVKCRPLDWAKKNVMTPSYMENTYTLCDGYVKVDNRFVDFSGYTHRNADQELPAFYTVSYLSEFVCYTGQKAWSGDTLTVKPSLPFWGGNTNAYLALNSKETWAAWRAPNGYALGVYTPMATTLLAGRHNYNGSKDAHNDATNYVAPLIKNTMKSFTPFEYTYYITTGMVEAIRDQFYELSKMK